MAGSKITSKPHHQGIAQHHQRPSDRHTTGEQVKDDDSFCFVLVVAPIGGTGHIIQVGKPYVRVWVVEVRPSSMEAGKREANVLGDAEV